MTAIRKNSTTYCDQERKVLLDGRPVSSRSTRFGHWKSGWHVSEIQTAWEILEDELLDEWESDRFARERAQHKEPWAVRLLRGEGRML
jgi:hypothetical protein